MRPVLERISLFIFHSYPTHLQALNEERNVEENGEKRDGYDVERDVSEVGRRPE